MTDKASQRERVRAILAEKAPGFLEFMDARREQMGDDFACKGVVLADGTTIGQPYPPEECERIAAELRAEPKDEPQQRRVNWKARAR